MADLPPNLPEWATGGSADVEEPSLAKKQLGWTASEKPPHEIFNWLFFRIYGWLLWLSTTVYKYEAGVGDPKEVGLKFHPNGDGIGTDAFKLGVTSIEGSGTPSLNDGARVEMTGRAPSASLIWSWTGKSDATLRTFGLNAPEWDEPANTASLHHMHGGRGFALANITGENSDGGRESPLEFWGTKADDTRHRLARIKAEHDGAGDDFKGRLVFAVNDGSAFDDLAKTFSLSSNGELAASAIHASSTVIADGSVEGNAGTFTTVVGADTVSANSVGAVTGTFSGDVSADNLSATTKVDAPEVEATTKAVAPNVPIAMARVEYVAANNFNVPAGHGVSVFNVSGSPAPSIVLQIAEDIPHDNIVVRAWEAATGAAIAVNTGNIDSANDRITVVPSGDVDFFIVAYGV